MRCDRPLPSASTTYRPALVRNTTRLASGVHTGYAFPVVASVVSLINAGRSVSCSQRSSPADTTSRLPPVARRGRMYWRPTSLSGSSVPSRETHTR